MVVISRCCERWWFQGWSEREQLVTQLLPYLLIASMTDSSTLADVKRLYNVRHALQLMDFDDASAETIRGLLVRTVLIPVFLRPGRRAAGSAATGEDEKDAPLSEGQRFIAFVRSCFRRPRQGHRGPCLVHVHVPA